MKMRTRLPTPAYGSAPESVPDPCRALELQGGWQGQETYGHLAWLTAKLLRSIWHGDLPEASDRGALLLSVLDQLRVNQGRTELALEIALEEPPPVSLFSPGEASRTTGTGWSPILPDEWTSAVLDHIREMDQLHARTVIQSPVKSSRGYWQRRKAREKTGAEGGGEVANAKAKGKGRGKGKKDEE